VKPATRPIRLLNVMCAVLLGLIGISAGSLLFGVRLNVMPSVPVGVYRITAVNGALHHGDLVLVDTEMSRQFMVERHGWLAGWWPIMKPIAGLPGDLVCHGPEGIVVERALAPDLIHVVYYGPAVLPQTIPDDGTCATVPEAMVYVASAQPRSLDSRYLGWIAQADLRGIAHPLWTW
jgi:conjugative transfer signal peptidase TraF